MPEAKLTKALFRAYADAIVQQSLQSLLVALCPRALLLYGKDASCREGNGARALHAPDAYEVVHLDKIGKDRVFHISLCCAPLWIVGVEGKLSRSALVEAVNDLLQSRSSARQEVIRREKRRLEAQIDAIVRIRLDAFRHEFHRLKLYAAGAVLRMARTPRLRRP